MIIDDNNEMWTIGDMEDVTLENCSATTITGFDSVAFQPGDMLTISNIGGSVITIGDPPSTETDRVIRVPKDGDIVLDAPVVFKPGDEALQDRMNRIEKVLGISQRHPSLEKEYKDLAEAGKEMDRLIEKLNRSYSSTISSITETYKNFASECEIMEKLKSEYGEVSER